MRLLALAGIASVALALAVLAARELMQRRRSLGPLTVIHEGTPPPGVERWIGVLRQAVPTLRGPMVCCWVDAPVDLAYEDGHTADRIDDVDRGRVTLVREPGALLHAGWHLDRARRGLHGGEPDQAWVERWAGEMVRVGDAG